MQSKLDETWAPVDGHDQTTQAERMLPDFTAENWWCWFEQMSGSLHSSFFSFIYFFCMYMCLQCGWYWNLPLSLSIVFTEAGSSAEAQSLPIPGSLASQLPQRPPLYLLSATIRGGSHMSLAFMWVLLQSLRISGKQSVKRSTPLSLINSLLSSCTDEDDTCWTTSTYSSVSFSDNISIWTDFPSAFSLLYTILTIHSHSVKLSPPDIWDCFLSIGSRPKCHL